MAAVKEIMILKKWGTLLLYLARSYTTFVSLNRTDRLTPSFSDDLQMDAVEFSTILYLLMNHNLDLINFNLENKIVK